MPTLFLSEQALDVARRCAWSADRVEVALRQLAILDLSPDEAAALVLEASAGRLVCLPLAPDVLKTYAQSVLRGRPAA